MVDLAELGAPARGDHGMRLDAEEQAMLAGEAGPARRLAMRQIVTVGAFFDAADCVEVSQVHLMADAESLGEAGVAALEAIAALPAPERRVRVPTLTDPRGIEFRHHVWLGQSAEQVALERRAIAAIEAMGILLTNTCINYQTVLPPVLGEHLAYGDTGSAIYANSVLGARSNFEGGPSALAAALAGRVPRYGLHLDRHRRGTTLYEVDSPPGDLAEWGGLGAIIGEEMASYWEVPVILGIERAPSSDQLKQFGAALASYGSAPFFHMVAMTPEALTLAAAFDGAPPAPRRVGLADLEAFRARYRPPDDRLDVVVFAAPQLSLFELRDLAELLDGRRVDSTVDLLAATSPEVKAGADRLGLTAQIEAAGGRVLEGVCFYQMYAREIGEARGWRRLLTNSAKLANIIQGYGYTPGIASMEICVESACRGRFVG